MNIRQKRKLLLRIQELEAEIEEVRKVRAEIAKNGYQSATLASNGGSKSYTHMDLGRLTEMLKSLTDELEKLMEILAYGSRVFKPRMVLTVYS